MKAATSPARAFTPLTRLDALPPGRPTAAGGICLLRVDDDDVIAFEDRCPHRGHPLSEGACTDGVLRCALHGWEFAIPSGEAVSPRAPFGLEFYDARVVDGVVEVLL